MAENKYAAPHVWNLAAKIIRENYPTDGAKEFPSTVRSNNLQRRAVEAVALAFARRFVEDEGFNPIQFLEHCSPNPDLYPLTELWAKKI